MATRALLQVYSKLRHGKINYIVRTGLVFIGHRTAD
jgi:hypothetical protein